MRSPHSSHCPDWEGHVPSPPSCQSKKKSFCQGPGHEKNGTSKNHSPTTGDPSYDGNGGTHFFGGCAIAARLGSTTDLRLGVGETLSRRIWATPWTLAPPSFACPWCRNSAPKTWFSLVLLMAARGQMVCSWGRLTLGSPWWQCQTWTEVSLRCSPLFMGAMDQSLSRARTWGPTQKSVPMRGTPWSLLSWSNFPTWCLSTNQLLSSSL